MTIFASIHGRLATEPKARQTSNGKDMTTGFALVNLDVHGDDAPITMPVSLLAFGNAALELARAQKGEHVTCAGQLRGTRYAKDGETVEGYQLVCESVITARSARSAPRRPKA